MRRVIQRWDLLWHVHQFKGFTHTLEDLNVCTVHSQHLIDTQFLAMFIEAFPNQLLLYVCHFFIIDNIKLRSSTHNDLYIPIKTSSGERSGLRGSNSIGIRWLVTSTRRYVNTQGYTLLKDTMNIYLKGS